MNEEIQTPNEMDEDWQVIFSNEVELSNGEKKVIYEEKINKITRETRVSHHKLDCGHEGGRETEVQICDRNHIHDRPCFGNIGTCPHGRRFCNLAGCGKRYFVSKSSERLYWSFWCFTKVMLVRFIKAVLKGIWWLIKNIFKGIWLLISAIFKGIVKKRKFESEQKRQGIRS